MGEYISKNALVAEIRRRYEYWREKEFNSHSIESEIRMSECKHLLLILDSLQEEPVSKDLEEAAVKAFKHIVDSDKNSFLEIFKAGAKWKEKQIMKDAIDAKIGSRVEGIIYNVDFNIDSNLEPNDKVKVIIIKNE